MPMAMPDTEAPAFRLPDSSGGMHVLADLLTRAPVLLAFYKVECPTCALVFPVLERLHQQYGLTVAGIAQNSAEEAAAFAERHGATFPQLLDLPFFFTSADYGIDFTPSLFLLSREGRIVETVEAWSRERYNTLSERIAQMLGAEARPVSQEGDGLPAVRPG
ncbi:MAG: TlpA family protein disulfide reductase [Armatimonadetes bacterium]|nr:TlpA family protein disulfide reductase [Armatimonadota bacterium]